MPTTGQIILLAIAVALFAAAGVVSVLRVWRESAVMRVAAAVTMSGAIAANLAVIAWHCAQRGVWIPIGDNFDALIWLATMLAIFVVYVQFHQRIGALDWFIIPVIILLQVGAMILRHNDRDFGSGAWAWTHRTSAFAGAVAFAIAAAAGLRYFLTSGRLRRKLAPAPYLGSLERLERLTMTSVRLGFALFTVAAITGAVEMFARGKDTPATKLLLAAAVWIVYALVLHAPINPSFRGRKVAVLSVVGFVLMIGTIVTVEIGR